MAKEKNKNQTKDKKQEPTDKKNPGPDTTRRFYFPQQQRTVEAKNRKAALSKLNDE